MRTDTDKMPATLTVGAAVLGLPLLAGAVVMFVAAVTFPVVVLYHATLGDWVAAGEVGMVMVVSWLVCTLLIGITRR